MRYILTSHWSLTERFAITDEAGTPLYEAVGHFGMSQRVSLHGPGDQEVAVLHKHLLTNRYDIIQNGETVAKVAHTGLFGQNYEIASSYGLIEASGDFFGWNYTLSRDGMVVATVSRQLSWREKFVVDTAPGEPDPFLLAVVLAIDNIHDERRRDEGPLAPGPLGGLF
ncbi:MAG TPA: hypothetical protein VFN61_04250 [Acidimicrobiales bacterium]|nr:hypothetical protein [Acidimicrobiales bacterium]